ncbi:DUF3006 domain-containing protein [Clostridium swellfunianum]|uniref:DUF3006 domain-containing protein n=1 Tax=Clostridium swellfunianum TaxID=1367462 RepID=UPI00202FCD89|nr:DUF3006 domain-containing protein [Clostridium swellfunianum]MCM0648560.1 DUF3006 domain-containing protein [Clostridium swellfunianum]
MKVTIDRFEGKYVVCEKEDNTMVNIEKSQIPADAKEGDVLSIEDNSITIDIYETKKKRKLIEELTKDIWS